MNEPTLFEGYEPVPPDPVEKLSAGRRLTIRQREAVEAGIHPLTKDRTRPDLGTCGDCRFRSTNYSYPKCTYGMTYSPSGVPRGGIYMTHGPATDCRAWWPACKRFEPADKPSSPQGET